MEPASVQQHKCMPVQPPDAVLASPRRHQLQWGRQGADGWIRATAATSDNRRHLERALQLLAEDLAASSPAAAADQPLLEAQVLLQLTQDGLPLSELLALQQVAEQAQDPALQLLVVHRCLEATLILLNSGARLAKAAAGPAATATAAEGAAKQGAEEGEQACSDVLAALAEPVQVLRQLWPQAWRGQLQRLLSAYNNLRRRRTGWVPYRKPRLVAVAAGSALCLEPLTCFCLHGLSSIAVVAAWCLMWYIRIAVHMWSSCRVPHVMCTVAPVTRTCSTQLPPHTCITLLLAHPQAVGPLLAPYRPEDHATLALSERLLGVRKHHNPEVRLVADTEAAWLAGVAQRVPGQGRSGSCRLEQYAGKAGEHWRKQVGHSQGRCNMRRLCIQLLVAVAWLGLDAQCCLLMFSCCIPHC